MNGILITIGKKDGEHYGPHAMANTLCICDCILEGKKDGDIVEFKGKGKLMEHEGKRYISVQTVDGEAVEDMDDYEEPSHEEEMGMDSEDALSHFMNNHPINKK